MAVYLKMAGSSRMVASQMVAFPRMAEVPRMAVCQTMAAYLKMVGLIAQTTWFSFQLNRFVLIDTKRPKARAPIVVKLCRSMAFSLG